MEYLEPYHSRDSSTCADYQSCLICVSDANCAWCELKSICTTRNQTDSVFCTSDSDINEWKYLVISPQLCPNCSNYVDCVDCIQSGYCEWWSQEAKCERRGRFLIYLYIIINDILSNNNYYYMYIIFYLKRIPSISFV